MLTLGRWQLPLTGGRVELLRHGTAVLGGARARGVETTIVRMPANFPPSGTATRELSGMGTPDLLGTYGTFSLFTSAARASSSGRTCRAASIMPIDVIDGVARGSHRRARRTRICVEPQKTTVAFAAYVDRHEVVRCKLVVGDRGGCCGSASGATGCR